jgi:hypothetical protein
MEEDDGQIDGEPRATLTIRCPTRTRVLWRSVAELASRCSGGPLADWQALEAVAAEAHSSLGPPQQADRPKRSTGLRVEIADPDTPRSAARIDRFSGEDISSLDFADPAVVVGGGIGSEYTVGDLAVLRAALDPPPALNTLRPRAEMAGARRLADGGIGAIGAGRAAGFEDTADLTPAQLDAHMRAARRAMQVIDWQMGCLLTTFMRLRLYRHAGFLTLDDYVSVRLGVSVRKARSLRQIEGDRTRGRADLAAAYRAGDLSWVRALALLPVLSEANAVAWIERAQRVTVRRLSDEVRWACDLRDLTTDQLDVLPPTLGAALDHYDAEAERQIRTQSASEAGRQIGTQLLSESLDCWRSEAPEADALWRCTGPQSVIELFRDVVLAVQRPDEPVWRAFELVLLHVKAVWEASPRHRNPIYERDGWRCRVPACSSRRNLHEHHIRFRSRGGGNERGNRIPVCVWHHLRGIHQNIVAAAGDAESEIDWQLGVDAYAAANGTRRPFMRLRDDVYLEG